jgi:hypothetical protein
MTLWHLGVAMLSADRLEARLQRCLGGVWVAFSLHGHTLRSLERVRYDPTKSELLRLDVSITRTG